MLRASQLTCQRGPRVLFRALQFELEAGHWLQVTGANGAGKTSLLRILAGISEPFQGTVTWNGQEVRHHRSAWQQDRLYLGHAVALKDELSPWENLRFSLGMEGLDFAPSQVQSALTRFGLGGRERLPVRQLSAGQRRRSFLCRLLLRPARVWILDEPFTALDLQATALVNELITQHLQQGGSAILTSHQAIDLHGGARLTL